VPSCRRECFPLIGSARSGAESERQRRPVQNALLAETKAPEQACRTAAIHRQCAMHGSIQRACRAVGREPLAAALRCRPMGRESLGKPGTASGPQAGWSELLEQLTYAQSLGRQPAFGLRRRMVPERGRYKIPTASPRCLLAAGHLKGSRERLSNILRNLRTERRTHYLPKEATHLVLRIGYRPGPPKDAAAG